MVTSYPGSFDTFIEPTLPEDTPLSQAGSGDRNHVEHHRDLGDAVEALERGASYKTHDHSGVNGILHGSKLPQSSTHESPDTDVGIASLHHTLDPTLTNPFKAAPALHQHHYRICTLATRPNPPHDGLLIFQTDTVQIWVYSTPYWLLVWPLQPVLAPVGQNRPPDAEPGVYVQPTITLTSTGAQTIYGSGTGLVLNNVVSQGNGYFTDLGNGQVRIEQTGNYTVGGQVFWDPTLSPNVANVGVNVNGQSGGLGMTATNYLRGGNAIPGASQTQQVGGVARYQAGDVITLNAGYAGAAPGIGGPSGYQTSGGQNSPSGPGVGGPGSNTYGGNSGLKISFLSG